MVSQTSGHGDFRLPSDRARRFGGSMTPGELMGIGFIADGRDEVLTATRENLRAGASQLKLMAGGGAAPAYDPERDFVPLSEVNCYELALAVGPQVPVQAFSQLLVETMQDPDTRRRCAEAKLVPVVATQAQTAAAIARFRAQWTPVVQRSGFQP